MMSSQIVVTNVACAIGPSVNPLQNRETQHVKIVLQHMYQFFEQLEVIRKPSNFTMFSTDFSSQNLVFWKILEFLAAEITLKSLSPTFCIQILPNKFH
jgi:patatin-like phospholipase/acyl hydrolase